MLMNYFIQWQSCFCGQWAQPYFLDSCGRMMKELMRKIIVRKSIVSWKLMIRAMTATIGGMNQSGMMRGMCFLNFSANGFSGFAWRSRAEICP